MEAMVATATAYATLSSEDDDSQEISANVNHLYLAIVDHIADERIRVLEEEIMCIREIKSEFSSNVLRRRYRTSGNRVRSSFTLCRRR
ncbi:hypothetical protein GH714_019080 [Hevea brasiliensis]|uniref:Uncharacterized protein n=1 Tax=Hevea brasiliensis TaxID=3981 RepID=A0A6A6LU42_HEVBR|nr:hypothetical protein GH714_019080 [Hevea brasiliensis]